MPMRADGNVGIADRLAQLAGEARNVLAAERLPEERLDALEAERQDLPHIAGRVVEIGPHHRADPDIEKRVRHRHASSAAMSTRRPVSALSIAAKTMPRLLMLSAPRVSGSVPLSTARDEILDDAEMAADAVALVERRHRDRLHAVEQPFAHRSRGLGPQTSSKPSQMRLPRSPTMRQPASQLRAEAVGAPAAAVGEHLAAIELEDGRRRRALAVPRIGRLPFEAKDSRSGRRSPCSARHRRCGSPCRAAAHGASPRGTRRNAARRRSRRECWSARRSRPNRESAGCAGHWRRSAGSARRHGRGPPARARSTMARALSGLSASGFSVSRWQ